MNNQVDLIVTRKLKKILRLKKARNLYIATLYDDLIKRKTLKEIHQDIQRILTIDVKDKLGEAKFIAEYTEKLAKKTKKKLDDLFPVGLSEGILAEWIFKNFSKNKIFTESNKIAYDIGQQEEEKGKNKVIEDIEKQAKEQKNVFYLCSAHRDSALDHVNYQGKIYVDERWMDIITDLNLRGRIAQFVYMNNIKTFQWVIGKPVWMITRPNCRHFFKVIDNEQAMSNSSAKLLKKHDMMFKVGRKETQTFNYSREFTRENIENLVNRYKERLEFHKALYQKNKNNLIARAIDKDKLLISKWEKYLSKLK